MTFAHSKGVMPPWMTLSSTGFLSGAAVNILGKYTFTIMAKDATGCEVNREYTVSSTLSRTASLCLVDDIDASKTAIVNFATGEYSINGGAVRLSKKGALSITDSQLALVDRSGGNEINIKVNRFDGRGQASARIAGTPVKSVYINDGSILNNPCVIRP